jgi:signal transduction histidine kinase
MKLFSKYNRINLTVMTTIFLLSGICYFYLVRAVLIHELDEALNDYKERIADYESGHGNLPPISAIDDTYVRYEPAGGPAPDQFSLVNRKEGDEIKTHRYRQLVYTQKAGTQYYRVTIAKALEGTRLLTKIIAVTTLMLLLLVILFSLLLNTIILRKLWKPFYETMHRLQAFKLGTHKEIAFVPTDIDEFRFLNNNLTATIQQAEQEYRILKEFTENASHEMQTPLAIVRSKLDLLIQQEHLTETQADIIKSAYSGIKRLHKLNQSLLLLAKIENRQYEEQVTLDLKKKITEKLEQLQDVWREAAITATSQLSEASVDANEALIDILLNNLFSNAARHNVPGGSIEIVLQPGMLSISNSGSGQALDPDKMFRRFYKVAQHSRHNGLGLSIIQQICEHSGLQIRYNHGGTQHNFTFNW